MNPDDAVEGNGNKKFKKGSQEAKDHMARIRAMRKSKSVGGNIIKTDRNVRDNVPMSIRPLKGSPEMKERMSSIRAFRKTKGAAGFFDDLASNLIHVGTPTVGHVAGQFLGGVPGAMVGEQLGNMGADAIGYLTGRGLRNNTIIPYGKLVDGIPRPVVSAATEERIRKKGYNSRQRGKNGLHILRGSFLELGR